MGNKMMCCLNLIKHVDEESRKILITHASKWGKTIAFVDDAFTSKKALPGYKPRLASAKWIHLVSVTHTSFSIMLRAVIRRHENTCEAMRAKIDKQSLERHSEHAAFISCLCDQVLVAFPTVSRLNIERGALYVYIESDPNLNMEIEAALAENTQSFQPMDLTIIKDIVTASQASAPGGIGAPIVPMMRVAATELGAAGL